MRPLQKTHFLGHLATLFTLLTTPWQYAQALSNSYLANGEVIIKEQQACFYANQPHKPIYGLTIHLPNQQEKQFEMLSNTQIAGNNPQNCIVLPYDFALDTPYFVVFEQQELEQSTAHFCLRKDQEQNTIATFVKNGHCTSTIFQQAKQYKTQRQTAYAYIGMAIFFWVLALFFRLPKKRKNIRKPKTKSSNIVI